jgi:phosphoribosylaminoimidazole-succinocarboxamide synthase
VSGDAGNSVVTNPNPLELPGWRHVYSGKVRDLYEPVDLGHSHLLLVVASNRVSAFDHVLSPEIPGKGANLTAMTHWWFDRLGEAAAGFNPVQNHRSAELEAPSEVADRAMVVQKLEMYPIECVVRGYLSGSGWKEYLATGSVCGIDLPAGLEFGDKLPEPIFTPAFKAELGEHDENISFERVIELVGHEAAEALRSVSLEIFARASELAAAAGLILADTKFEFGHLLAKPGPARETLVLADEVLTPDSSRYWSAEAWAQGVRDQSFDKQIVRNWLAANWDQAPGTTPPALPAEIVDLTAAKYAELATVLTGR